MWRSKKFLLVAVLATMVLAGSIGGIALAQTENDDDSQPQTLLERVAAILVDEGVNITSEQLKDAFTQAQSDIRTEAMEDRLAQLVQEGVIEQDEADAYLEWQQVRPDVPVGFGFGGRGGFRGMGGVRGFGGLCAPWNN